MSRGARKKPEQPVFWIKGNEKGNAGVIYSCIEGGIRRARRKEDKMSCVCLFSMVKSVTVILRGFLHGKARSLR